MKKKFIQYSIINTEKHVKPELLYYRILSQIQKAHNSKAHQLICLFLLLMPNFNKNISIIIKFKCAVKVGINIFHFKNSRVTFSIFNRNTYMI